MTTIAQNLHHPELAAVLAHSPVLGYEAADIAHGGQGLVGQDCHAVLFGAESGKMPADDVTPADSR